LKRQNILIAITILASFGCHRSDAGAKPPATGAATAYAYFAGGCFWGVEHFLEKMDGVASVESGYMGGHVANPSYKQVSYTDTGHIETVRVTYDPKKVTYAALARRFFEIHDPTQVNRQGPDVGKQYRSAIFTSSPSEKRDVKRLIGELQRRGYKVATELLDNRPEGAARFWLAEDYHQDYYVRTKKQPYCHTPVPRFDRDAK